MMTADRRFAPIGPVRHRQGWRQAPMGLLLAFVSVPVAAWFSTWGLNGIYHCNHPHSHCGLGFVILIPLAWLVSVWLLVPVCVVAALRVPAWAAWTVFLATTILIWLVDLGAMSAYRPH